MSPDEARYNKIVDDFEAKKKETARKFFQSMLDMEGNCPPYGELALFLSENDRINDVDKKEILRLAFFAIRWYKANA